jgi:enoyl-CoA hydratase/carnithine racemase
VNIGDFTELRYEVSSGVAVVTLNRADRKNAWSGPMALEYRWALHHAHVDPAVRVVVVTGAGDHFCVGADAGALDAISGDGGYARSAGELPPWPDGTPSGWRHNHTFPLTISTPVIAALRGICAGAGVVLATYADMRFAASGARIATSFSKLGLPAEYGTGWMLARIMGVANAALFCYDGRPVSGSEAAQLGFVQRVVPDEELFSVTLEYARRLAGQSSGESLRVMKRQLFLDAAGDLDTAYRRSVADMDAALGHADFKEGLAALRERRPARFL